MTIFQNKTEIDIRCFIAVIENPQKNSLKN